MSHIESEQFVFMIANICFNQDYMQMLLWYYVDTCISWQETMLVPVLFNQKYCFTTYIKHVTERLCGQLHKEQRFNTVDSRYLEFQGTL